MITETKPPEQLAAENKELRKQLAEAKKTLNSIRPSELRYRRVFEAAHDGILILNADTGRIEDANPFMTRATWLYSRPVLGRHLWEIGLFKDIEQSKAAFCELQEKGYIRYEDMPLQDANGVHRQVEFVSNVYDVGDQKAIQCNIRDITERKLAEHNIGILFVHCERFSGCDHRQDSWISSLLHGIWVQSVFMDTRLRRSLVSRLRFFSQEIDPANFRR